MARLHFSNHGEDWDSLFQTGSHSQLFQVQPCVSFCSWPDEEFPPARPRQRRLTGRRQNARVRHRSGKAKSRASAGSVRGSAR